MDRQKHPAEERKPGNMEDGFTLIKQGAITNFWTKLITYGGNSRTQSVKGVETDRTIITARRGGGAGKTTTEIRAAIEAKIKEVTTADHVFFNIVCAELAARGMHRGEVIFSLEEYARYLGANLDMVNTRLRRRAWHALAVMLNLTVAYSRTDSKGREKRADDLRLAARGTIKNSMIRITLTDALRKELTGVMPFPRALLKVNQDLNPNTYYFGAKLAENKHMNYGKANADIISVDAMLAATPKIPPYSSIKTKRYSRHVKRWIIGPFARDMNALISAGVLESWQYCDADGQTFTVSEVDGMKYTQFCRLRVKVTWVNYPDQYERARLQRKEEQKAAKRAKQAIRKAAKQTADAAGASEAATAAGSQ